MIKTVTQIGNSLGVILPSEFVQKNKIEKGSKMAVTHSNGFITFSPRIPKQTEYEMISDADLAEAIAEVETKYGNALDTLAKIE